MIWVLFLVIDEAILVFLIAVIVLESLGNVLFIALQALETLCVDLTSQRGQLLRDLGELLLNDGW